MRIALNLIVVLVATAVGYSVVRHFFAASEYAHKLFAPVGAPVLFPYERDTIYALIGGLIITFLHVLFLAVATLWVSRWNGWHSYLLRCLCFVGTLAVTVSIFLGLGLFYRHAIANKNTARSTYYAIDMPVRIYAFGVFAATVGITIYVRTQIGHRQTLKSGQIEHDE